MQRPVSRRQKVRRQPKLGEQFFCQLIAREFEIAGNVSEDLRKGADFQWRMRGDGDMVLSSLKTRRQAHVAAGLASDLITVAAQDAGEVIAAEVARKFHAGMTSSFTR